MSFSNTTTDVDYTILSGLVLSANSLNLDSFRINAMVTYPNSTILVIGIENYGVLLYDMNTFNIITYISVIEKVFF